MLRSPLSMKGGLSAVYWTLACARVGAKCFTSTISFNEGHLPQFTVEETEAQRAKGLVPGDTARKGQGQDGN